MKGNDDRWPLHCSRELELAISLVITIAASAVNSSLMRFVMRSVQEPDDASLVKEGAAEAGVRSELFLPFIYSLK
jgi:hypothetical protein